MDGRTMMKVAARSLAVAASVAAAGYSALIVLNRRRYGDVKYSAAARKDSQLDWFVPDPEVAEHHEIEIAAPANVVMAAAKSLELMKSPVVRGVIRAREIAMGAHSDKRRHPSTLFEQMQSMGWVVLSERAGREVVMGAVTQPWVAAPVFRSIPSTEFRDFSEPGYVKIAWTLRVDPVDGAHSIFSTDTRVRTTDSKTRQQFRDYWSFVAPGVKLIRMAMLHPLRRAAERRVRAIAAELKELPQ